MDGQSWLGVYGVFGEGGAVSDILNGKQWHVEHADCIEHMRTLPDAVFDMAVFSPPFPALYAYTGELCDIGNSESDAEMKLHLGWFYRQLARVMKPGRVVAVHVMQIPRMRRAGMGRGLRDFRGLNIRLGERSGLVYEYDWAVRKNPQAQAIRTKSRELQFSGLESDRSRSRGALADYVIKFTAPGDNETPINSKGQVTRNQWIDYAECVWTDIQETDTLNVRGTKGEDDTRHICPLQLPLIDRLIRLYSNPDEIVFSPFTGIGSEGVKAIENGRRFYGCEIKSEYLDAARRNIGGASLRATEEEKRDLFATVGAA